MFTKVKAHNVGTDGLMSTNRHGKVLCQKYQRGECKGFGKCPFDPSRVHQCARCLSQEHGAFHPTECKEPARKEPVTRPGRGKGGGKGRGKY